MIRDLGPVCAFFCHRRMCGMWKDEEEDHAAFSAGMAELVCGECGRGFVGFFFGRGRERIIWGGKGLRGDGIGKMCV